MTTTFAFERLVDALRDHGSVVKGDHGKAQAQCPAHDDGTASLSVTRIDGSVLIYCHAGCSTEDVLGAVKLTMADLFDEPRGATYAYPDGRRVHRTPDKTFRQSGNTKGDKLFRSDRIGDADVVFVTEGEKDVLAIESIGGVAVCPAMGAGKAHKFNWTPLRGRNVTVVADNDDPGRKHACQVAELLKPIAESVRIVTAAVGKDAADHIAAGHTLDELDELVDVAEHDDSARLNTNNDLGAPPDHDDLIAAAVAQSDRDVWPSPSAPLAVAHRLFRDWRDETGLRTLVCHRGTWMRWEGPHWAEMDTAALRKQIYDQLGRVNCLRAVRKGGTVDHYEPIRWDPNKKKIADVLEAMAAVGHISADIDPPAWLLRESSKSSKTLFNAHGESSAGLVISCANGLLDLSTRTLKAHTPGLYNVVSVPFDYQENPPAPVAWLEFLRSVWPDDDASTALLQEYIGYLLSGRTEQQKMLGLFGPTRSGKGTIGRLLPKLIGRGHVVGPTLASLGTNFGLAPLLGKPLAIISDARLGSTPGHLVVERLLSITGEDMLTVDRKFREPWSGKLPTRFVILSNELPRFSDSSGAIAHRLLILQMLESFLGREDRELDAKLATELPGILKWALEGLDRLNRNGRFTVPASSEDAANLMMDLASPTSAFVRDLCERGPGKSVERDRLYGAWKLWCEDNGHEPGAKATFGRNLRAVVPDLRTLRPRSAGKQIYTYTRIGLALDSLDSRNESAGQSHSGESGKSVDLDSLLDSPPEPERPPPFESSNLDSCIDTKPQVNGTESSESGKTPFKAQQKSVCRFCGGELRLPSQQKRRYCGAGACVVAAREQTREGS